ncbi:MAG: SdpI family protein [Oscillospiraceae bacterium]|nr:SdpI family protein [Oscillospiraceae bacterium]MDD7041018.1 SdpI family protein [Oscillospiraceae bacterium]MDY2610680.1 SdpI family protein [Oscillospiraceae bacterium]
MKNKHSKIIIWILAALSPILCAVTYPFLPQQVPMHWDINGTVSYEGKETFIFMAVLPLLLAGLFIYLPKIDPRKKNYAKFSKYYDYFCMFMMVFLLIANLVVVSESFFPGRISVGIVIQMLVGVLFLFLGNMMPKFKSNFFVGIKNPWTLSNTDVWNRTHRLSGILMFGMGIVTILTCFWLPPSLSFWLMMGMVLLLVLVPTIMSYIWYRKLPEEKRDTERDEK